MSLNGVDLPAGNLICLPASHGLQLESSSPRSPAPSETPRPQGAVQTFKQDRLRPGAPDRVQPDPNGRVWTLADPGGVRVRRGGGARRRDLRSGNGKREAQEGSRGGAAPHVARASARSF